MFFLPDAGEEGWSWLARNIGVAALTQEVHRRSFSWGAFHRRIRINWSAFGSNGTHSPGK